MKVMVCDPIAKEGMKLLEEAGLEVVLKTGQTPEELAENIAGFHAVIVRSATKVRKVAIDKADVLKVIGRGGVGLDNIDVTYAKEKGIAVRNTPTATSVSVAELAFSHMLCAARRLPQADASMKQGKWEKKKFKGTELYEKTLGLIGCGRIAREVARRALAFGMRVIATDPYSTETDGLDIELTEFDRIISESDFISLHIPLTDETRHIIGDDAVAKMKDGVVIINCARGGTVSEEAVVKGLESGKVRYAGFDVFSTEPVAGDEAFLKAENASFTPHIGASTAEGQIRAGVDVAQVVIDELKA